jgi:hypothetical protein
MTTRTCLSALAILAVAGTAAAQPTVDGSLDPQYGPIQFTQNSLITPQFFDNRPGVNPCVPFADGLIFAWNNSNTAGVTGAGGIANGVEVASAAAVRTGVEVLVPLASIGSPTGSIRIAAFINGGGSDFLSNQVVGGLGGLGNLGEPRLVDFSTIPGQQFVTANPNQAVASLPTVDGTLSSGEEADMGAALFVQDTNTQFGDSNTGAVLNANGSEIDNTFARVITVGGVSYLYVFFGGNYESNYNKIWFFLDTGLTNGQQRLRDDNPDIVFNQLNRMGGSPTNPNGLGLQFDAGFTADYALKFDNGGNGQQPPNVGFSGFADIALIPTPVGPNAGPGGRGRSLGGSNTAPPGPNNVITAGPSCPPPPTIPDVDQAVGSELDGVFATVCGNNLHVLLTGNLQTFYENNRDGNRLDIFLDVAPGGQNTLRNDNTDIDNNSLNSFGADPNFIIPGAGFTFDAGFEADYWIAFRNQGNPVEVFAWASTLRTGGANGDVVDPTGLLDYASFRGGAKSTNNPLNFDGTQCVRFDQNNCASNGLGSTWNPTSIPGIDIQGDFDGVVNTLSPISRIYSSFAPRLISARPLDPLGRNVGNSNLAVTGLIQLAINNSNTAGVSDTAVGNPAAVTTGLEFVVRLDEAGWTGGAQPIKLAVLISNNNRTIVSNQLINRGPGAAAITANLVADVPGFQGTTPLFANLRSVDLNTIPGDQFLTIAPGTCSSGPVTGACCLGVGCTVTTQAACAGAVGTTTRNFRGVGTVCNAPGTPPFTNNTTPCCRADFNQNGTRNPTDIFNFLTNYFSAVAADKVTTDTNGNGTQEPTDIFNFLTVYFAGGC